MMETQGILIVGLGNPGKEYEGTRHNVGFHVIDQLTSRTQLSLAYQKTCKAQLGISTFESLKVIFAKPMTFMNLSGESVGAMQRWYSIAPQHIIIIADNVDLPIGRVKVKTGESGGTHNGMRSIRSHLQSVSQGERYIRLYLGIGASRSHQKMSSYVLGKWHSSETDEYMCMFQHASTSIEDALVRYRKNPRISLFDHLAHTVSSYEQ